MNRPVLAITAVGVGVGVGVVGGVILTYSLTRPGREAPATTVTANAPAPLPPSREAPPAGVAPPTAARRAPATKAEPAPAPAEAPIFVGVLHIDSDVPGAQVFIETSDKDDTFAAQLLDLETFDPAASQ